MANTTVGIGLALVLLGLVGYLGVESHSPTALIPAGFGVVLAILGWLARDASRRKLVMHIAVTVGLVGLLGALVSLIRNGGHRPVAAASQAAMVLLTGVFVALCVRSFIAARRNL